MILVTETEPKTFVAQKLTKNGAIFNIPGKQEWYNTWMEVKVKHPQAGNLGWGMVTWKEK